MCHQIFMAVKVLDISIDYQTNKDNSTTTKDASKHDENMFTTVCDVFRLNSVQLAGDLNKLDGSRVRQYTDQYQQCSKQEGS